MSMTAKILLIDDDALVLASFRSLFLKEGYEVKVASSYEEALNIIRTGDFNLVVSDIRMPGKDGVETVKAIQECLKAAGKKDLPIIFITGYAEDQHRLRAEVLGETLYKPVDNQKLLQAIREYL